MKLKNNILDIRHKLTNSTLVKHSGVYTISNLLEKGIPFLILPIIARLLSKEDVGYYTLYQAILTLLIPLYTLSIGSSIILNFFKIDKEKFKVYFSNGLFLFLIVFTLFSLIFYLFSNQLSTLIKFPYSWLFIVTIIVFLQFFTTLRKSLWQINNEPKKYAVFSVALALVKNLTGLLLIYYSTFGWKGIIVGHFVGQLIFAIFSFSTFIKEQLIVIKYNKVDLIDLIKVGTPLSVHRFGAWLSDSLNRFVISALIGVSATGSYGIGATFGIFVTICQDAFNRAYVPYLFHKLKHYTEQVRIELVKTTIVYYIGLILFSSIISIVGVFTVGFIFGNAYNDTRAFIVPLVFAAAFNGLYKIHTNYIFFTKKTHKIMNITFTMGIINVGVVYFLVRHFGILGAAYATVVIQFLSYLLTFYVSNKIFPIFFLKKHTI